MALPENRLSTTPAPIGFVGARALPSSKIVDYEDGGIAIQDTSMGLLYQRWRALLFNAGEADSYVQLDAPTVAAFTLVSLPGMTEISFTFDQLMRPVLAYVQSGSCYLRWYDSAASAYVTDLIGAGIVTPRVAMDDKRFTSSGGLQTNDVILAYVRGGDLYYRQQRDRYTIERLLKTTVKPLVKVGFSRGLRFQFMFEV